jgi:hypothetical protein
LVKLDNPQLPAKKDPENEKNDLKKMSTLKSPQNKSMPPKKNP